MVTAKGDGSGRFNGQDHWVGYAVRYEDYRRSGDSHYRSHCRRYSDVIYQASLSKSQGGWNSEKVPYQSDEDHFVGFCSTGSPKHAWYSNNIVHSCHWCGRLSRWSCSSGIAGQLRVRCHAHNLSTPQKRWSSGGRRPSGSCPWSAHLQYDNDIPGQQTSHNPE